MTLSWRRSKKRLVRGQLICPECSNDVAADCMFCEGSGYDMVEQTKAEVMRKLPPY